MELFEQISERLQKGKAKDVKALVQQAIDEGFAPQDILEKGLISGMNIIGEKFRNNEVFVPEVLVAARAMNMGTAVLKPILVQEGAQSIGRACIGTVMGDLHDIGKNLVKTRRRSLFQKSAAAINSNYNNMFVFLIHHEVFILSVSRTLQLVTSSKVTFVSLYYCFHLTIIRQNSP